MTEMWSDRQKLRSAGEEPYQSLLAGQKQLFHRVQFDVQGSEILSRGRCGDAAANDVRQAWFVVSYEGKMEC